MTGPTPAAVKAVIMDADQVRRSLSRMAHEVVERNHGVEGLVVVGVISGGDVLARRLARHLSELEGREVQAGSLDPTPYRDDGRDGRPGRPAPELPSVDGQTVVLVDDVLHHGRTVRAAMEALLEHGRPRAVQLAVLVDRGHRELPIRADFVGKNLPTRESERVEVRLKEDGGADEVVILQ